MPSFAEKIIAAHQAGRQAKQQDEDRVKAEEDRKLQQQILKHQIDRLKIEDAVQARKAAIENANLLQGQPGPQANFPAQGETPVGALPGQTQPLIPAHQAATPLPGVTVPGIPGIGDIAATPSVNVQPQSMQELLQQQRQQKIFDSMIRQQEEQAKNQVQIPAIPGLGINEPATVDQAIAPSLISQAGQGLRQGQQQTFTAGENALRLKAESDRAALDRKSREDIANANRLAAAARAAKTGATSKTIQQAMTLSNRFDTNPITKQYGVLNESLQFVNSLDPKTTNPADDQGLIYAFAKAMDPNSVVREGEYATVQKYVQSWAEKFGFDAKRLYSNTAFLTPEARQNLKTTILTKAKASESQYQNLKNEFGKKFQNIGENPAGWLTDLGPAGGGPTVGSVQDGYVYLGGDPANSASWKKQ